MSLVLPASALAASPPTVISSFVPSSIGVGDTSALSYWITDPPGNGSLTGVGFTDTLPSGLFVDTPNGTNISKGCTGSPTLTANSGSQTIELSGATVAAGRADTATVTSGSDSVTDSSITSGDAGKLVTGTGIPPLTYVGTVTPGASFLLTSTPSTQVNVNATADGSSVTISPFCNVSVSVTSNTAGAYQNSTGDVTSNEGGDGNSDTETLTVLNPPTVTLTSPANHATYAQGQKVIANYSCQDDPNGPGIAQGGCQGNVPSGSAINTTRPGLRSFTVTATSEDGQVTFKTVSYTVAGSNKFAVRNLYSVPKGRIGFDVKVQSRGKLEVTEKAVVKGQADQKPVAFGQLSPVVSGDEGFAVYPSSSGKALVSQVRSANSSGHHEQILVTVTMKFTPPGATARTQTYEVMVSP